MTETSIITRTLNTITLHQEGKVVGTAQSADITIGNNFSEILLGRSVFPSIDLLEGEFDVLINTRVVDVEFDVDEPWISREIKTLSTEDKWYKGYYIGKTYSCYVCSNVGLIVESLFLENIKKGPITPSLFL